MPMKQSQRQSIIIFLDQMGKFSFIDLFVSLYMIVSFYVSISEIFHGYGLNIKVVVEPDIGLNTFVIGTVISMIFSHYFLYLDAKYATPPPPTSNNDDDIDAHIAENDSCSPLCVRYAPQSMLGIV